MTLLILGLALWFGAHLFKRLAPDARARMGNGGRGLATVLILLAVVLMVLGYRSAEFIHVWAPPPFLTHLNNLLMLLAVFLFAADGTKAMPAVRMRHPQLTAVKTWATAHLLVNGDLASIILFGGLLAWAVVEVIVINRSQPDWTPRAAKPGALVKALIGTVIVLGAIMAIHNWLGVQPWP